MRRERATALQRTQIGLETTPGTQVAATKRLLAVQVDFNPNVPVTPFRPMGWKANRETVPQKEQTDGSITGDGSFYDLCYLLSGACCVPTIVQINGAATLTYEWTFLPDHENPDTIHTFTVEQGDPNFAERVTYGLISALGLRFTRENVAVTGTLLGQTTQEDPVVLSTSAVNHVSFAGATGGTATLALGGQVSGPLAYNISGAALQTALEALSTIGAGNVEVVASATVGDYDVYFKGSLAQEAVGPLVVDGTSLTGGGAAAVTVTQAGAAATDVPKGIIPPTKVSVWEGPSLVSLAKLLRVAEFEFNIADRYSGQFTLDESQSSFSAHVERAPTISGQLTMQRDADFKAFMQNLRNGDRRYVRLIANGPAIETIGGTTYNHMLQITFPYSFRDPRSGNANDVRTGQLELVPEYDETFGFIQVVIRNTMSAL